MSTTVFLEEVSCDLEILGEMDLEHQIKSWYDENWSDIRWINNDWNNSGYWTDTSWDNWG